MFLIYWFVLNKKLRMQNAFLILVSYIFYGWWDWRFLTLIIFSSFIDYTIGLLLTKKSNYKKHLLFLSVFVNLGLLGFFKYFNFFIESFATAFTLFGFSIKSTQLNIILPIGISFYTFQTLSYTIDIYKGKLIADKDAISFFAFVSFFPQLVAGPIERASNLLPQFHKRRKFSYEVAVDGMRQILWGLFKKIVIADNCAQYANEIFNNYNEYGSSTLIVGAVFFTFQIYGDFSGYSDVAIGVSRLFGFNLKKNFATPYFSRDIAEFWRRWHISLSTWFRDYLYIPIGGSIGNQWKKIRNIFIIFIISGLWHGANWTFIVWGGLNALYFLPILIKGKNRKYLDIVAKGKNTPSLKELILILWTFGITVFAWIFFRVNSISHAFGYISKLYSKSLFSLPEIRPKNLFILLIFFIIIEWLGREEEHTLYIFKKINKRVYRWLLYLLLVMLIIIFQGQQQDFIYFQF